MGGTSSVPRVTVPCVFLLNSDTDWGSGLIDHRFPLALVTVEWYGFHIIVEVPSIFLWGSLFVCFLLPANWNF